MSAPVTTATAPPAVGAGSDEARAVGRRLLDLVAEPALADRHAQLRALAHALSDRDRAAGWDELPLHTALGFPIPPDAGRSRLATSLGVARVALVFVPVAVTWAGVSWAGWLYQRELARDPELGPQSFFRLWLTGFDGAMPPFHLMAVVIAVAVLAIIGLTIAIGREEAQAAELLRRIQGTLSGALTDASVLLARGRPDSPERFLDDLTRASEGITSLVTQVRSATEAASVAMQGAGAAAAAAQEAATQAQQGASELAGSVDTLAEAVGRTEAATSRLLADAISRGDAAAAAVTTAVGGAVGGLTAAVTALQSTVDELDARQGEHRDKLGLRLDEHEKATRQLLPDLVDRIALTQTAALDTHLADLRDAIRELAQEQRTLAAAVASLKRRPARPKPSPPPGRGGSFLRRLLGG